MVTETDIEELEAEVEEKREQLEAKRREERYEEAKVELREIRDEADERIGTIEDREREKEEQQAVESGDAYFCNECGKFTEYGTGMTGRRKDEDRHEEGLCASCFKSKRQEEHKEEFEEILGDTLTITDYRIDKWQTDKVRQHGGIGAIDMTMKVETESGEEYWLKQNYDNSYGSVKEIDDDG